MNKILYLIVFLVSCNNPEEIIDDSNKTALKIIEQSLAKLDYESPEIRLSGQQILIKSDKKFPDDGGGNVMLLNYLKFDLFNSALDSINITIDYGKSKYSSFFARSDFENRGSRYHLFSEKALARIKMDDCVYYDLTVEMIKPQTHYTFEGDIWVLIAKLSENDEEAKRSFIAFYDWSKNPYNADLSIDRKKYDWFVKEIGIDPKSVDISFVDSLYQQKGYKGFFKQ